MSLILKNNSLDEANGNVMMGSLTTTTAAAAATMSSTTAAANFRNSSNNNDEDSASSNYTDPEQNDSAPTELLAEFLTSIMRKDYANALRYCKMILEYEPNNKPAKDFYPELLMRVNQQQQHQSSSSSSGGGRSDENCNYTESSLEVVDNEILDNDMIDDNYYYSDSSSLSSSNSNTTTNGSMDLNSYSDEDAMINQPNELDESLINQLYDNSSSSVSNASSKSDPFPESQSSSESIDHRMISPSFSFTSLLLEESDEINGNEPNEPEEVLQQAADHGKSSPPPPPPPPPSSSSLSNSPFTSKIVNMIRRKLN